MALGVACAAALPARWVLRESPRMVVCCSARRVAAHPIRLLDEAVNVQEAKSCRIETLAQSRSHFLYQLVSQLVILFAFCAQALAIQRDRSGHLHRARVEPPAVGGYQPRPSEHLAAAQSLNRQAAVTGSNDFERDFSFADEIEGIGFCAFFSKMNSPALKRTFDAHPTTSW